MCLRVLKIKQLLTMEAIQVLKELKKMTLIVQLQPLSIAVEVKNRLHLVMEINNKLHLEVEVNNRLHSVVKINNKLHLVMEVVITKVPIQQVKIQGHMDIRME